MTETKEEKKLRLKRSVIIRHRRNKGLCERCGKDIHNGSECIEDYTKSDMRSKLSEPKPIDLKKKKDTIIIYRKKKGLCERCGLDGKHDNCIESYEMSDMRSEQAKKQEPKIVPTPKSKGPSILEQIEEKKDIELKIKPKRVIKLQRDFIVLNLFKSRDGNIVEYTCLNQLSRRFHDYILCLVGRMDRHFPYSDVMKIRKLPNILEIRPCDEQTVVNYIGSCKKLFTFHSKLYIPICIKLDIPYYEFQEGKNATNFLPDIAYQI